MATSIALQWSSLDRICMPTSISHGCRPPLKRHNLELAALSNWDSLEESKGWKSAANNIPKNWTASLSLRGLWVVPWGVSGWCTSCPPHSYKVRATESWVHLRPKCFVCPSSYTVCYVKTLMSYLIRVSKMINPVSGKQDLTSPKTGKNWCTSFSWKACCDYCRKNSQEIRLLLLLPVCPVWLLHKHNGNAVGISPSHCCYYYLMVLSTNYAPGPGNSFSFIMLFNHVCCPKI